MPTVTPEEPAVPSILSAGLLLAALSGLEELGLPHPSAAAVIQATGVSKSRAYEVRGAILALLPALIRPPGRPSAPAPEPTDTGPISRAVLAFLMDHPGAVTPGEARHRYSDGFRHRVVELALAHPDLDPAQLAEAVGVPAATLKDWLASPERPAPAPPATPVDAADATHPQIASVLEAWSRWDGGFAPFCTFVRGALAIPFGTTLIRRILAIHAGRRPRRRPGRSPDEAALRDALVAFFPGAQWFADGSSIAITVHGRRYRFNWELDVDGATGALVGASVGDEEDAQAVVAAFEDGVATTGQAPLALTTDNRAPNHTPEVDAALGDTVHLRTTPARPQNNSPVEGAFGLFAQTAPPLVVEGDTPRHLARAILILVLTTWARATNHRPRNDRRGRTRVQLYRGEQPSQEQIAAAKAALEERRRRQTLAARTRQARLDPIVRALLDDAFTRLALVDPQGHVKDAIARYPHDAVLAGIATFDGKRAAGTLPDGAGPRYLLGIVRQITHRDEGIAIADALWQARRDAQDRALARLEEQRRATTGTTEDLIRAFVDRALAGDGPLLRSYWLRAATDVIAKQPLPMKQHLYNLAGRRITTTFRVDPRERQAAVRYLATQVLPIA
jgi:hypothetical protein